MCPVFFQVIDDPMCLLTASRDRSVKLRALPNDGGYANGQSSTVSTDQSIDGTTIATAIKSSSGGSGGSGGSSGTSNRKKNKKYKQQQQCPTCSIVYGISKREGHHPKPHPCVEIHRRCYRQHKPWERGWRLHRPYVYRATPGGSKRRTDRKCFKERSILCRFTAGFNFNVKCFVDVSLRSPSFNADPWEDSRWF